MRLRGMRRGQRERSGSGLADYLETCTVGSHGGRMEKDRESGTSPAAYPIFLIWLKNEQRSSLSKSSCSELMTKAASIGILSVQQLVQQSQRQTAKHHESR